MAIGRFLMGAALGGLLGGGVLTVAALVAPLPEPRPANRDAAPVTEAEAAPGVGSGAGTPDPALPAAQAPAAPDPAPSEPVASEPAPSAVTAGNDSTPPVAADVPPATPTLPPPGAEAALPGDTADALPAAPPPAAPPPPEAEDAPKPPAQPVAAPDLALNAPDPALVAPGPQDSPASLPGMADAPAPAADPALAAPPDAEVAPTADLPVLPPLTPEEEAMIAGMAEPPADLLPAPEPGDVLLPEGAAIPDSAIVLPEDAFPDAPVAGLDPDAAPSDAPPAEAPLAEGPDSAAPAPDAAPARPEVRRVGQGEGSTLPATPPLAGADAPAPDAPASEAPASDAQAADAPVAPASSRPIDLYARPFANPDAKPLYAVILIDDGAADLDRAALADLPFAVTFALDPQAPGAADHAAIYRDAGQEVVMLATGLPQGATAADVETTFGVMAAALPQTVAVMDTPGRSFQSDRPLATLVVPVIGAEGRGLVTWDEGLNAADQVARREDVPSVAIFRHLDAGGESAPVIRRYLDRAAFKAAQEGAVAVVGTTRAETVAALLEWTVEGRAGTVALAPVTAVLSVD